MSSTPTRVNRAAKSQLHTHPRLLRIVVREAHDARRQALLVAVELADLDLSADPGKGDAEPRKRDGLLQDRRAGGAGDHAALGAADMDAIAVADRVVALHLEAHQHFLRVLLPPK